MNSNKNKVWFSLKKKYAPKVNKNGQLEVWTLTIKSSDGVISTSAYTSFTKVINEIKRCYAFDEVEFTDEIKDELKTQWYANNEKNTYIIEQVEVY